MTHTHYNVTRHLATKTPVHRMFGTMHLHSGADAVARRRTTTAPRTTGKVNSSDWSGSRVIALGGTGLHVASPGCAIVSVSVAGLSSTLPIVDFGSVLGAQNKGRSTLGSSPRCGHRKTTSTIVPFATGVDVDVTSSISVNVFGSTLASRNKFATGGVTGAGGGEDATHRPSIGWRS